MRGGTNTSLPDADVSDDLPTVIESLKVKLKSQFAKDYIAFLRTPKNSRPKLNTVWKSYSSAIRNELYALINGKDNGTVGFDEFKTIILSKQVPPEEAPVAAPVAAPAAAAAAASGSVTPPLSPSTEPLKTQITAIATACGELAAKSLVAGANDARAALKVAIDAAAATAGTLDLGGNATKMTALAAVTPLVAAFPGVRNPVYNANTNNTTKASRKAKMLEDVNAAKAIVVELVKISGAVVPDPVAVIDAAAATLAPIGGSGSSGAAAAATAAAAAEEEARAATAATAAAAALAPSGGSGSGISSSSSSGPLPPATIANTIASDCITATETLTALELDKKTSSPLSATEVGEITNAISRAEAALTANKNDALSVDSSLQGIFTTQLDALEKAYYKAARAAKIIEINLIVANMKDNLNTGKKTEATATYITPALTILKAGTFLTLPDNDHKVLGVNTAGIQAAVTATINTPLNAILILEKEAAALLEEINTKLTEAAGKSADDVAKIGGVIEKKVTEIELKLAAMRLTEAKATDASPENQSKITTSIANVEQIVILSSNKYIQIELINCLADVKELKFTKSNSVSKGTQATLIAKLNAEIQKIASLTTEYDRENYDTLEGEVAELTEQSTPLSSIESAASIDELKTLGISFYNLALNTFAAVKRVYDISLKEKQSQTTWGYLFSTTVYKSKAKPVNDLVTSTIGHMEKYIRTINLQRNIDSIRTLVEQLFALTKVIVTNTIELKNVIKETKWQNEADNNAIQALIQRIGTLETIFVSFSSADPEVDYGDTDVTKLKAYVSTLTKVPTPVTALDDAYLKPLIDEAKAASASASSAAAASTSSTTSAPRIASSSTSSSDPLTSSSLAPGTPVAEINCYTTDLPPAVAGEPAPTASLSCRIRGGRRKDKKSKKQSKRYRHSTRRLNRK